MLVCGDLLKLRNMAASTYDIVLVARGRVQRSALPDNGQCVLVLQAPLCLCLTTLCATCLHELSLFGFRRH
jgi:hypothetical protein